MRDWSSKGTLPGTLACLALLMACGGDDDAPVDAGSGTDAATDASADAAGPDAGDAAPDGPRAPGDVCGDPIDIATAVEPDAQGAYHISGNLDDFEDDLISCGLDNYDGDAVYLFVPPADGLLRTTLDEGAWADLVVRTQCDDVESNLTCTGYHGWECAEEFCGDIVPVTGGVPLYLVIDGLFRTARDYTLTVQPYPYAQEGGDCAADGDPTRTCPPDLLCREEKGGPRCRPIVCGDGLIEGDLFAAGPAEACDDGNQVTGDGCSDTCSLEDQGSGGEACADAAPFHLVPMNENFIGAPYGTATGDTSDATADLSAGCAPTAASPDEVYVLTVTEPIPFLASLRTETPGFEPVLYILTEEGGGTCSAAELDCSAATAEAAAQLQFAELAPGTYYIVVDGADDGDIDAGAFTLEALAIQL